jgi:small ligand-binding sensory domain FIST
MSIRIGAAESRHERPAEAARTAVTRALAGLGGAPPDLVLLFTTGTHSARPELALDVVGAHSGGAPLAGCAADALVGRDGGASTGGATSVWAAHLDGRDAAAFHLEASALRDGRGDLPRVAGARAVLLLPDPYSASLDEVLRHIEREAPGVPVLGGMATGRALHADPALFLGDHVMSTGTVGVRLDDVEVLPVVGQGSIPVGPELTVTGADGHVIREVGDRSAYAALQDALATLGSDAIELLATGMRLGIRREGVDPTSPATWIPRNILSANRVTGDVTVSVTVRSGDAVRLFADSPGGAEANLREALRLGREALGGAPPAGALMFTCAGRTEAFFGSADRDLALLREELGPVPAAGIVSGGEIGPVGGTPQVQGMAAVVGLFPR